MGRPVALRFRTVAFFGLCLTVVLEFTLGVAAASATTLIMPNREALMGTPVVVWGNTTQANGTAYSIDCGNGTVTPGPTVTDQSYISGTCTYAAPGTFNAKLTVGAEVATAVITVGDPATLVGLRPSRHEDQHGDRGRPAFPLLQPVQPRGDVRHEHSICNAHDFVAQRKRPITRRTRSALSPCWPSKTTGMRSTVRPRTSFSLSSRMA